MSLICELEGLTTRSYTPYVKSVLGVDINQKMLDQYMKQARNKGFADKMSCVCIELKGADHELDGTTFDVITVISLYILGGKTLVTDDLQCSMAYHHLESIEDITAMLVKFRKPNGMLFVVDIEAPPDPTVATREMERLYVPHYHGFRVEEMKTIFEGAGLVSFDMKHITHVKFAGMFEVDVFLAKGVKPAE